MKHLNLVVVDLSPVLVRFH